MKVGSITEVPGIAGRWSVWSKAAETPGAHFLVPADVAARATGVKYVVARIQTRSGQARDVVELLRTDPALELLRKGANA